MGIWDDLSAVLDKGSAAMGRFADAANLKFKYGEEERKRRELFVQLGESLYETVRADPALAAGRDQILEGIARCDAELARVKAEMDRIAAEEQRAKAASAAYMCPMCGAALSSHARFCQACGAPLAPIESVARRADQESAYTQAVSQEPFGVSFASYREPVRAQDAQASSPIGVSTYESPVDEGPYEAR